MKVRDTVFTRLDMLPKEVKGQAIEIYKILQDIELCGRLPFIVAALVLLLFPPLWAATINTAGIDLALAIVIIIAEMVIIYTLVAFALKFLIFDRLALSEARRLKELLVDRPGHAWALGLIKESDPKMTRKLAIYLP